ncbi:hypothetical protein LTR20_000474 [Exophiala xenobiotica]|nr:hypothetical protein LTS13_004859 [Exophiala xenobiotica]KAK5396318.1 hypothetical protein LTR79_006046 [Exophiala xenobiotica]KAK5424802.1 hypothetical protein LTR90_000392 [Exophiala xenobiotica]KAK5473014.1 hypothetical protein LTR20_000474 [Exophiala xenobiotica]KAK5500700.1 hypothetical protein LTR26_000391 [Exophiala xenobiotica]
MSEISILGFLPDSEGTTTPLPMHWSILISPVKGTAGTSSMSQPQSKSKPRLFRPNSSSHKQSSTDTTLFDMHDHQLRQQPFPIASPVSSSHDFGTSTSSGTTTTTTSITSSIPNHPLHLAIRIALSTHHSPPSKLSPKLSTILYQTPTYGPPDDWLRAALEQLISANILESPDASAHIDYKASSILDFIHASLPIPAQDLSLSSSSPDHVVVDLDYPAQLSRTAQVKAMFNQPHTTSSRTPSIASSTTNIKDEKATAKDKAKKRFLGFWLTHGSGGHEHHPQRRCAYQPHPWQRQDDPYGGLMSGRVQRRQTYTPNPWERTDDPYGGLM